MKKVLLGLLALALVGALTGGGLFAYFSDTETSTGNTFQAGTIDISLSGDLGVPVHGGLIDFKPCETGYLIITITNDGMNPADVWKLIDNVQCWEEYPSQPGDPDKNDIDTVTHFGMWIERGDIRPDPPTSTDYHHFNGDDTMIVAEIEGWFVSTVADKYIYIGTLNPGESITIVETFHMDGPGTTNWAQGDMMQFDETFFAQQVSGNPPPPPPGPELSGHGKP